MKRMITKKMRDSFNCRNLEITEACFYQGGEQYFDDTAKKQRILILRRVVK